MNIDDGMRGAARAIRENLDEHHGYNGHDPATAQVLGLAEEAGEFVGAYRRWIGAARRSGTFDDVRAELADVVIVAYVTAEYLDIDLDEAITTKLATVFSRGWKDAR